MNQEKLKEALAKYQKDFWVRWPHERYKWEAAKWFGEHWDINADDFAQML
jgi:5-methylcytosine-specific restriction protein B